MTEKEITKRDEELEKKEAEIRTKIEEFNELKKTGEEKLAEKNQEKAEIATKLKTEKEQLTKANERAETAEKELRELTETNNREKDFLNKELAREKGEIERIKGELEQKITDLEKNLADLQASKNNLETQLTAKIDQLNIKSTVHQQTQTDFLIEKKGAQIEAKKNGILHQKEDFLTPTEEEIKWEAIKVGLEKETDLTRLTSGAYWDIQIQTLPDNLLPANKKSIVLKNRYRQREQQLRKEKGKITQLELKNNQLEPQTQAQIQIPPQGK